MGTSIAICPDGVIGASFAMHAAPDRREPPATLARTHSVVDYFSRTFFRVVRECHCSPPFQVASILDVVRSYVQLAHALPGELPQQELTWRMRFGGGQGTEPCATQDEPLNKLLQWVSPPW